MRAFRPKALAEFGPWGETKIYEFIKRGLLPARKVDGTTFVIEDDWNTFLRNHNKLGGKCKRKQKASVGTNKVEVGSSATFQMVTKSTSLWQLCLVVGCVRSMAAFARHCIGYLKLADCHFG
jgi:hypothetical protein